MSMRYAQNSAYPLRYIYLSTTACSSFAMAVWGVSELSGGTPALQILQIHHEHAAADTSRSLTLRALTQTRSLQPRRKLNAAAGAGSA